VNPHLTAEDQLLAHVIINEHIESIAKSSDKELIPMLAGAGHLSILDRQVVQVLFIMALEHRYILVVAREQEDLLSLLGRVGLCAWHNEDAHVGVLVVLADGLRFEVLVFYEIFHGDYLDLHQEWLFFCHWGIDP
jgi:hypothetical protein